MLLLSLQILIFNNSKKAHLLFFLMSESIKWENKWKKKSGLHVT